jgi:hypothetical protein
VIVKQGSGCWKIGAIVVAILAVLGVLGFRGAILIGGAAIQSIDEAVQESVGLADTTNYEVEITKCESDQFFDATAAGTIKNLSDTQRSFQVNVRFTNPDGSLISTEPHFTDQLDPGQSTGWEVISLKQNEAVPGFKCEISEVNNSIFGN